MKKLLTICIAFFASITLFAQTEEGIWETHDSKTNKAMSYVQVYKKDGKLYGKVIKNLDGKETTCSKCSGADKNKPIIGLMVIRGLEKKGSKWVKDDGILDPVTGFVCDGEVWQESADVLMVKGSVLFFKETQKWTRVKQDK